MAKKIISIIMCAILILPTVVFADDPFSTDKSYEVISNVSKTVLSVLSWFGYAIALGILIWIGIKYMLSTANEAAKLKGTFKMYIIGVVMILLCSTIAKSVANVASSVGDNSAEGIVDKGLGFKDIEVGNIVMPVEKINWVTRTEDNGIVTVKLPEGSNYTYSYENGKGVDPAVYFPETNNGEKFSALVVEVRNTKGELIEIKYLKASDAKKETSGSEFWFGSEVKWEIIDGEYKFEAEKGDKTYDDSVRLEYTVLPIYENMRNNASYVGKWNSTDVNVSVTIRETFAGASKHDVNVVVNKPLGSGIRVSAGDGCIFVPTEVDGKKLIGAYCKGTFMDSTNELFGFIKPSGTRNQLSEIKVVGDTEMWLVYEGMEEEAAAIRFNP